MRTPCPRSRWANTKGLEFTRRVRPVSEKAVELEAANLTRTHAPLHRWKSPPRAGCASRWILRGFMDGAPIPESKMENVTVVLGTGQLMPAAEDAVYGHKAGESFRFDFTYPAEFRVPELSGKTAQFAITLHTVEQKQPVPLDDAFAKTLGFDTVDALKESIREKKRRSHEANADRIAGAALLGMAGANLTAELDNAILDQNADHDMNALRERLRRSKMTMELYCKAGQTTPDEVRAAFRRDAERKMRSILAVQAIAKAEQITVSNAEVDAEYVRLSKLHDTPEAEIRNVLSRDAVASAVTTQKVQRFLIDHANITSVVEKGSKLWAFYTHRDGYADENYPSRDQPPPVLEPASPSQALHRVQGYLPLWRTDLYPPEPCQGLGPLYRVRPVRFCLPQRLHHPFAGAGAAGHLCRRYRQ